MPPLRVTLWLCALLAVPLDAAAQGGSAPPATFRYTATQLDCSAFEEHSRAQLDGQTGTRLRRETLTRHGLWRLRARPAGRAVQVEAWYDSLALKRESAEGTLTPDTDGLLGGRYRGTLSATGKYTARARPFIPDEVAEVAELSGAMEDLLPPLPPVALAVGQRWSDSSGLELERLPDSTAGRRVIRRLALRARSQTSQATVRGDTITLPARQTTIEEGQVDWDPTQGLVRRDRHIVVETTVPAGGPLRQPLRSRLEQDIALVRGREGCGGR
ncbi:MAG TPA: hypothetical protein VFG66_01035 [Gemmatimonadales bacterium]|nr:hypothetical protein [Gemmatimonadales bacterium]